MNLIFIVIENVIQDETTSSLSLEICDGKKIENDSQIEIDRKLLNLKVFNFMSDARKTYFKKFLLFYSLA